MSDLSFRDRELVAIGAALGANCVPCIEHHVPEARKAGLSDAEIRAAIELAERIRKVPAAKVLAAALAATGAGSGPSAAADPACSAPAPAAAPSGGKCC